MSIVFHERVDIAPGQLLKLRPDVERCHLFDAKTVFALPTKSI
jgi:hypothetical protein